MAVYCSVGPCGGSPGLMGAVKRSGEQWPLMPLVLYESELFIIG